MKTIDRIFNGVLEALIVLAKIMLVAMTLIICVHVFYRYVLNSGIKWSEEVSMLLYVYFGSVSVIYGVRHGLHIGIELFFNALPKPAQRVCEKFEPNCLVYLSPVFGKIEAKEIVEYMKSARYKNWRLQLQLHKYIWPPDARGV